MTPTRKEQDQLRDRAAREIALAEATGAKAHASTDNRLVFITRPDGTEETVKIRPPSRPH
ncbi:MAG: hypothetical protein GC189_11500 [Alphaproteobacteria bacterium]|nr:hypothetical protein [Alphaproteobacteria bacterium]